MCEPEFLKLYAAILFVVCLCAGWPNRAAGPRPRAIAPAERRDYVGLVQQASQAARQRWLGWPRRRTEVARHRALQFLAGDAAPFHHDPGCWLTPAQPQPPAT